MTWTFVNTSGEIPVHRCGHTATFCPADNSIYLFGGKSKADFFNDLYSLELNHYTWRVVHTEGARPSPRTYHAAVYLELEETETSLLGGSAMNNSSGTSGLGSASHISTGLTTSSSALAYLSLS